MENLEHNNSATSLENDFSLLLDMIDGSKRVKEVYRPGPYWINKSRNALNELKRCGINQFRGYENGAASSFADNPIVDVRSLSNYGIRRFVTFLARNIFPFSKFLENQVHLTLTVHAELKKYKNQDYLSQPRIQELLKKYKIPEDTIRGGCVDYVGINQVNISHHYLNLLDTLDHMNSNIQLNNLKNYMEIGGGFGANLHLMLENFKNLKKIIYLDIVPNLYMGTQYLKSFYGEAVKSYSQCKSLEVIKFQDDDSLEIFCISPEQIEKLDVTLCLFHNANSFVEMPEQVVRNYSKYVEKLLSENGNIYLVSYDKEEDSSTVGTNNLQEYFSTDLHAKSFQTVMPDIKYSHFSTKSW